MKILMFADDLKVYNEIRCVNDHLRLQNVIDRLHRWCEINMLYMNIRKVKVMTISKKKINSIFNYKFAETIIDVVHEHKDLGVFFEKDFAFGRHIDVILSNGNRSLGCVKRFAKGFNLEPKKLLYFSLVRSQIEYACQIWAPYTIKHVDLFEKIQKSFTIWALEIRRDPITFKYPPYCLRNEALNMKTLMRRRAEASLIFMYDLITEKLDAPWLLNTLTFNNGRRQTSNMELIKIETFATRYAMMQPMTRLSRLFNKIAKFLFETNTRAHFKAQIYKVDDQLILPY